MSGCYFGIVKRSVDVHHGFREAKNENVIEKLKIQKLTQKTPKIDLSICNCTDAGHTHLTNTLPNSMQLNLISTCTFTCQRFSPRPQTSLYLQICSKQFRSQVGFQQHLRTHTGDLFPCNVCGEKFQSKHSASRHEKDLHGVFGQSKDDQQKVWRCGVVSCGAEFNGEEEQRLHARTAHQSRSSVLICKMCRKICTNRAALRSHMQKLHPGKGKREVNLK